ncbi:hypothetical protein [Gemmatimonas sp.]
MVSEQLTQQGTGGRVTLSGVLVTIPPVNGGGYASQTGARYYYRADEKLGVVQRYDFRVGSSASLGSWEEYWYDALGRRILTARGAAAARPRATATSATTRWATAANRTGSARCGMATRSCTNGAPPTAPRPA